MLGVGSLRLCEGIFGRKVRVSDRSDTYNRHMLGKSRTSNRLAGQARQGVFWPSWIAWPRLDPELWMPSCTIRLGFTVLLVLDRHLFVAPQPEAAGRSQLLMDRLAASYYGPCGFDIKDKMYQSYQSLMQLWKVSPYLFILWNCYMVYA